MISHSTQIRVGYKDTDKMGIVHHSNYIVYYEIARTELFREIGLNYAELEKSGIISPILEVQSKYLHSAYYDEVLTVKAIVEEEPMVRLRIKYEILNDAGVLINTGMTVLGFLNSETLRPCRAPQEIIDVIRKSNEI